MSPQSNVPEGRAANDTEVPSTLEVGEEFATNHWRIHRYRGSVTATHLENAGKRGKKCLVISVGTEGGAEAELDLFVGYLLQVIVDNPRPETLAAVAKDANLVSRKLRTTVGEKRGVDVETEAIRVDADLVKAHFAAGEFRITVTAMMGGPKGPFRQDSHMYNADRKSAKAAYAWAQKNAARIGSMTRHELYAALREAGARVSTWG